MSYLLESIYLIVLSLVFSSRYYIINSCYVFLSKYFPYNTIIFIF